jgi:outer membrane protein OmpA-like peptidoglycan-associated protein
MKLKQNLAIVTLGAVFGLSIACGSNVAPRELEDAREAFHKAKEGPAGKYALAQLEEAKQALQEAESAFGDGEEDQTKDLAYVAERRAQLANAAGALEEAKKERADAIVAKERVRDEYTATAEKRLSKAERALEEKARKAAEAAAALDEETRRRKAAEKKAAAALASLEELAKVKEEARGVVITLSGSVLFASGKYTLLPIAASKLDEVARALSEQGYKDILVEGHTDARGSDSANLLLSERRAEAVRSHLVSRGITSTKIRSVGIGESRPIASNDSADGRANNRRVELVVQPE